MGKQFQQNLHQQQSHESGNRGQGSSPFFCQSCSMGLSTILKDFNFRCFFVLILTLSLLVSLIFWILPHRTVHIDGFDAKDSIKLSASVQVYFRLQKPVSELLPSLERLEYDINGEVGVPNAKVAILSMHALGASNWTDVVFGVLSERINVPINQVYLSVLRSSLIDVFLGESNLTLTASIFGQPSVFEILKFPGGITVVPVPYVSIWQFHHVFFSFTLNNSIAEVLDNLSEFRQQLKVGLHLKSYEYIVVQISNDDGSTVDSPVSVRASFISDLGSILPQRLQQLAQTISNSPSKNLGLDNSVFGKVKSVSLSTYLKHTLHTQPPTPSPAPAPELNDFAEPPISPSIPPSYSPSGDSHSPIESPKCEPHHTLSPVYSPAPSVVTADPPNPGHRGFPRSPHPSPSHSTSRRPSVSPTPSPSHSNQSPYVRAVSPYRPPVGSPLPQASYGSSPREGEVSQLLAPSPSAPSPSSSAVVPLWRGIWWLGICGVMMFHFLY
ncbi:uncharacterized protein [Euphorbia lathyris]|uniref:uncharacterized protein n=1 Tax=Euphorbia lathyris TaxID=212925 RepID=UPI003313411C